MFILLQQHNHAGAVMVFDLYHYSTKQIKPVTSLVWLVTNSGGGVDHFKRL